MTDQRLAIELPEETLRRWTAEVEGADSAAATTAQVEAFCESGQGHANVQYEPPDPSVGIFGGIWWCEDCGTDLTHYELRGFDEWDNNAREPRRHEVAGDEILPEDVPDWWEVRQERHASGDEHWR